MKDKVDADRTHDSGSSENDDVPLWYALAAFMAEDINTSLPLIYRITDNILRENAKYFEEIRVMSRVSLAFSIAFLSYAIWIFISTDTLAGLSIGGAAFFAIFSTGLSYFWHRVQYGKKLWPDEAVDIPHDKNQQINAFISILQKPQPNGKSIAYYYSSVTNRPVFVDRRQFFGALRYLLFAERPKARSAVTRFWTGLPAPANIYIRQSDLERILAARKPTADQKSGVDQVNPPTTTKRRFNPGRTPEYPYCPSSNDLRQLAACFNGGFGSPIGLKF
ncbi:MAG: hypothetical protein KJS74_09605 [Rhodospirillales bacterium]|nr:hypothetical protein [Rhodospirillales bacterium]